MFLSFNDLVYLFAVAILDSVVFFGLADVLSKNVAHYRDRFDHHMKVFWRYKFTRMMFMSVFTVVAFVSVWMGIAFPSVVSIPSDQTETEEFYPSFFFAPFSPFTTPFVRCLGAMALGHYFFEMTVKVAYGTSVFKTNLVFSEHIPSLIAAVGLYFGLTLGWAQPLTVALAALEVAAPFRILVWMQIRCHYTLHPWFFRCLTIALFLQFFCLLLVLWLAIQVVADRVDLWYSYANFGVTFWIVFYLSYGFYISLVNAIYTMMVVQTKIHDYNLFKAKIKGASDAIVSDHTA